MVTNVNLIERFRDILQIVYIMSGSHKNEESNLISRDIESSKSEILKIDHGMLENIPAPKRLNLEESKQACHDLKTYFLTGATLEYEYRIQQLKALKAMVQENEDLLCEALKKDLGKPKAESRLYELNLVVAEVNHFLHGLKKLMKPCRKKPTMLSYFTHSGEILFW